MISTLWRVGLRGLCVGLALGALTPGPAATQGVEESRLLREAAVRESQGDLEGAMVVLRRILEVNPASSGGIFALERVLRARGEVEAMLPATAAFLARDPGASAVRHLRLRLLLEADSLASLEQEAEAWFRAQPASETAYREVSHLFHRAFGPQRALAVLERGRSVLGRPQALALEMGDLLVSSGNRSRGLEEWARAVGEDGAQASVVSRRVAGLSEDPRGAARTLVGLLGRGTSTGSQRAGVQIALDAGLERESLELAGRTLARLDDRGRTAFLADVARRARDAGLAEVATWAYGALGQDADTPTQRRQFDLRLVEISLAAGDTATALDAQRRVAASYPEGSVEQRRARGEEVRLMAGGASADEAYRALIGFRERFPEAPELDALAAQVARALLARGAPAQAEAVLEGLEGPHSSLERGYLLLGAGRAGDARASFMLAVPGLDPAEATGVIQFVALLGRLSPPAGSALAQAGALAHGGRGVEGAAVITDALPTLPEAEHPALLAAAARMADLGGDPEGAAELRLRLLTEAPASPEAAEAALERARFQAGRPDGISEALLLLEELIVRTPEAAAAPEARRELERLRRMRR